MNHLLINIVYNTFIFFTSICIIDRVVFYFIKTVASISGIFQMMSYEITPPSFINQIIDVHLEIGFFVIFIFYFFYIFNISIKPIDYFKKNKWNKLIVCSFIIFALMIINHAQATYLNPSIYTILASYFFPISWFYLFHIYNLKYLERIDANYTKFPFYTGIVSSAFFFNTIHPFIIKRAISIFN